MFKNLTEAHKYTIWQGNNGRWYTYISSQRGDHTRKLVAKKTREELEKFLIHHYAKIEDIKAFCVVFNAWNDRRLDLKQISPGSHSRYLNDFNRYFFGFADRKVDRLSVFDYVDLMERQVADFGLDSKAFARIKAIIKGTVNYAKRIGYIDYSGQDVIDEFKTLDVRLNRKHREDYQEVYTDDEMAAVMGYLEQNQDDCNNAIYLLFLTGMRVGEAVALKHSDIIGNTISVRRTETSWSENGIFYREVKDSPKTAAGYRTIVVPSAYDWFLKVLQRQNAFEEFVFKGKMGDRLSENMVQTRLRKICHKLGIYPKSPHKIRKTYCSILLDNKLDANFIKGQVGHTDIWCTENYYHRNRKDIEQKTRIIDSVPEFGVISRNDYKNAETVMHKA